MTYETSIWANPTAASQKGDHDDKTLDFWIFLGYQVFGLTNLYQICNVYSLNFDYALDVCIPVVYKHTLHLVQYG